MKKVVLLLTAFFVCLAAPMSYLVMRTYQSIEREERAEFRFFTESLFDRIEGDLARIVIREESGRWIIIEPTAPAILILWACSSRRLPGRHRNRLSWAIFRITPTVHCFPLSGPIQSRKQIPGIYMQTSKN